MRQPPPGRSGAGDPGDDRVVLAARRHQPEGALAQADGGVELRVERQVSGVEPLERRTGRRVGAGEVDERRGDVDAVDDDAPAGQLVGVAPGTAPDVEHPLARPQAERGDDVVDLLHRPLGERVAQVRTTRGARRSARTSECRSTIRAVRISVDSTVLALRRR